MILTISDGEERILSRVLDVLEDASQVRQPPCKEEMVLFFSGLTIYPSRYQVFLERKEINLTNLEFGVLLYLAQHPLRIFTKRQIQEAVWKEETESYENAVQCVISSLRRKLRKYTDQEYIQTVWGIGYKFKLPEA